MSIVNQMLRDIESRQESVNQLPLHAISEDSEKSRLFIYAVIFCCALLACGSVFLLAGDRLFDRNQIPNLTDATGPGEQLNSDQTVESRPTKERSAVENIAPQFVSAEPRRELATHTAVASTKPAQSNQQAQSSQIATNITSARSEKTQPVKEKLPSDDSADSKPASAKAVVKRKSQATQLNAKFEAIQHEATLFGFEHTKNALNELLKDAPDFHRARLYLIQQAWQNRDPEAAAILQQAVALFPTQSAYKLAGARYFLALNQFAQAEQFLQNIDSTHASAFEMLQMRAILRQKQNQHQLAVQDYSKLLQLSPERGDIYLALGISLESLAQFDQARLSFKRALLDNRLSPQQLQFARSKIQHYNQLPQG